MAVIENYLLTLPPQIVLELEALASAELDKRCSFDWAGQQSIPCAGSAEEDDQRLTEGGFVPIRKVTLAVRIVSFADPNTLPEKMQTITYRGSSGSPGKEYRITNSQNHFDAWLELVCEYKHKGS